MVKWLSVRLRTMWLWVRVQFQSLKHWPLLNIKPDYRKTFKAPPIIAFEKNVPLKQKICTNIIRNNKKYLKPANFFSKGKCSPCYRTRTIWCKQVNTAATFKSNQTNEIYSNAQFTKYNMLENRNTVSHKIEQPQERHQGLNCNTSL